MARENDVVLIKMEDSPLSFARVEKITPDTKKDWYHIKLLLLQLPLQTVNWILKEDYINGEEFHMGGKPMILEPVVCPEETQDLLPSDPNPEEHPPQKENGNLVSFAEFKKTRNP
ncbi:MAG: hypothetical protein D3926_04375 [Desulfobacteraceae bacterium]|nr:MAG: hypothetical protein D3926_04375 [Desulfobacteraceae bacterium]